MSLEQKKILKIAITTESRANILKYIRKCLINSTKIKNQKSKFPQRHLTIVTPNPEQIVAAQRDKDFASILNQADIAIPDGIGIVWASRVLWRTPLAARISGIDLMRDLVAMASKERIPIGLIGGRGTVAVKALECLQKLHPGLRGWAEDGPEIKIKNQKSKIKSSGQKLKRENREQYNNLAIEQSGRGVTAACVRRIVDKIRTTGVQIIFVGLGAPKQESFIETLNSKLLTLNYDKPLVLMAVGGAFDIISGNIRRAPLLLRRLGIEWLWRLFRQPRRARRQFALLRFIGLVLAARRSAR